MSSTCILHTDSLTLRPPDMSDAHSAFDVLGCRQTTKGRSFAKNTFGEAKGWLSKRIADRENDGFGWWVIETKDQQAVGFCGFFLRNDELELGYVIKATYQRNGYGREAVEAALAFANLSGFDVYATIRPSNAPSKKVAEQCGMKLMPDRLVNAPELDLYRTP